MAMLLENNYFMVAIPFDYIAHYNDGAKRERVPRN